MSRIPADSIVVAAGRVDLGAVKEAVFLWLNAEQRQKAGHLLETFSGFTLGRSLPDEVLPALGPGAVGVLAAPRTGDAHPGRPVLLFGLEFRGGAPMARAIENGVRSAFTLVALDPKRREESLNLGSRTIDGQSLTTLNGADARLAAGVSSSVLALGNQAESVAGFLSDPEPTENGPEPMALRDRRARFPEANVFLHVDLDAAYRLGTRLQTWLVQSVSANRGGDEVSALRDVEQMLGLMRLFRAGYLTRSVSDDLESVRHSLVLVPRDDLSGSGSAARAGQTSDTRP